jgi:hypothetical protein
VPTGAVFWKIWRFFVSRVNFVAIYRPMVYRIGRRAGLQDSDAEDLAQLVMESVAKAIPNWEKDPQKGGFRAWRNCSHARTGPGLRLLASWRLTPQALYAAGLSSGLRKTPEIFRAPLRGG